MSLIVLYFLYSTSVLSFYIDVVLTLFGGMVTPHVSSLAIFYIYQHVSAYICVTHML